MKILLKTKNKNISATHHKPTAYKPDQKIYPMSDRTYHTIFSKSNFKRNKLVTKYRRENKIYLITTKKWNLSF